MHTYNGVLTILGLACFLYFVFCVSVKVKLTVPLLCVCVHSAWKGCPRNDLCCVGWDVKPYSLTLTSTLTRDNAVVLEVAFVKFLQLHFPFNATLR